MPDNDEDTIQNEILINHCTSQKGLSHSRTSTVCWDDTMEELHAVKFLRTGDDDASKLFGGVEACKIRLQCFAYNPHCSAV